MFNVLSCLVTLFIVGVICFFLSRFVRFRFNCLYVSFVFCFVCFVPLFLHFARCSIPAFQRSLVPLACLCLGGWVFHSVAFLCSAFHRSLVLLVSIPLLCSVNQFSFTFMVSLFRVFRFSVPGVYVSTNRPCTPSLRSVPFRQRCKRFFVRCVHCNAGWSSLH